MLGYSATTQFSGHMKKKIVVIDVTIMNVVMDVTIMNVVIDVTIMKGNKCTGERS